MHTGSQTQGSLCMLLKRVSALPRVVHPKNALHALSTVVARQSQCKALLRAGYLMGTMIVTVTSRGRELRCVRRTRALCGCDGQQLENKKTNCNLIHERCCCKQQQLMQQAHCQGSCCLVLRSHWSPSLQVLQPIIIL